MANFAYPGTAEKEVYVRLQQRISNASDLFERGISDRPEPLYFAAWGDPAFDGLLDFVLANADVPAGVRKIETPVLNGKTGLVGWEVSTGAASTLVTKFEQLRSVNPRLKLPDETLRPAELARHAQWLDQTIERSENIEEASAKSGAIHRRTHLLLAASLLSLVPKTASLADFSHSLPDASRLLGSARLEPDVLRDERLHGLLKTDIAIYIPTFYQPFLANTLRKERLALKKARKGVGEDNIPLTELADRLRWSGEDFAPSARQHPRLILASSSATRRALS